MVGSNKEVELGLTSALDSATLLDIPPVHNRWRSWHLYAIKHVYKELWYKKYIPRYKNTYIPKRQNLKTGIVCLNITKYGYNEKFSYVLNSISYN